MECDASNYALGYILSQEVVPGKTRKIVCFGSKALSPTQQNYSATERECLAVYEGVKYFHPFIHGHKFKIVTDHKSLVWLMNHQDHTSKLMRWAIKLQGYDFEIIHRPGKNHANVDALSRLAVAKDRVKGIGANNFDPTEIMSVINIAEGQRTDPKLKIYIKFLEKGK